MSENVFILGAGASRDAGAPLMNEFLDKAYDLSNEGRVGNFKDSFHLVEEFCQALRVTQSNAALDIHNLESVFALVEMAELLGRLGDTWDRQKLTGLRSAIIEVIVHTLGETIKFPIDSDNRTFGPCPPYGNFAELIYGLWSKWNREGRAPASVITFNYDPCLDDALFRPGLDYDYCLSGNRPTDKLKLLKLHGSLNWTRCELCDPHRISYWDVAEFVPRTRMSSSGFPLAEMLRKAPALACKHPRNPSCNPFLVPPTYNKGQLHSEIAPVWQAAADELREAENIYVFGFSLPDTDQFFLYLYALGTIGGPFLRNFLVFDPDPKGEVQDRFSKLLGPSVKPKFARKQLTFREAIDKLRSDLGV